MRARPSASRHSERGWQPAASQAPKAIRISPATAPTVSLSLSNPTPSSSATTGIT
jgi:hypothetical protein